MNRTTTLSTLAKTQPPEPLLEHEIRLRAYDLYEQQGPSTLRKFRCRDPYFPSCTSPTPTIFAEVRNFL
jgi:hypothetical protein